MIIEWIDGYYNGREEMGMVNLHYSHVFIDFVWPMKVEKFHMLYDGLPLNTVTIGFLNFGWGRTHEWFTVIGDG